MLEISNGWQQKLEDGIKTIQADIKDSQGDTHFHEKEICHKKAKHPQLKANKTTKGEIPPYQAFETKGKTMQWSPLQTLQSKGKYGHNPRNKPQKRGPL